MSALAVAALGKQYAGGTVDETYVREHFAAIGLTDDVGKLGEGALERLFGVPAATITDAL